MRLDEIKSSQMKKQAYIRKMQMRDNPLNVWGDEWDAEPASGRPSPPNIEYIKKVGVLRNSDIELHLVQNSDFFSVYDAVEDVIALGWEKLEEDEEIPEKRRVFKFGDTKESVDEQLYEYDLVLKYKENKVTR